MHSSLQLGSVTHTCSPSPWEAEPGQSVQVQCELHSDSLSQKNCVLGLGRWFSW